MAFPRSLAAGLMVTLVLLSMVSRHEVAAAKCKDLAPFAGIDCDKMCGCALAPPDDVKKAGNAAIPADMADTCKKDCKACKDEAPKSCKALEDAAPGSCAGYDMPVIKACAPKSV